jgi:starch phosphorylase
MYPGDDDLRRAAGLLAETLPAVLRPLATLAYNYRWSWAPLGPAVFERVDAPRWHRCGHNPVRLLSETSPALLRHAAVDPDVRSAMTTLADFVGHDLARPWAGPTAPANPVAFLCAEFGIHASVPVYSGGLGVLAGDLLKEASDLGLAMVGVGLMYRTGYFHQRIDTSGYQHEYWIDTDPDRLPAALVTGPEGQPLRIVVPVLDVDLAAQVWRVDVGRVPLYLLDTDLPENPAVGRWVTSRLYEGNPLIRLAQYAVLGVGGARALRAMGIEPSVYHLNEGHPALAAWELLADRLAAGASYEDAWAAVRSKLVFTTHTPVAAGNETYEPADIAAVLGHIAEVTGNRDALLAAGRVDADDPAARFGLTPLAIRASRSVNGVSRRHGEVARAMWQGLWPDRPVEEVPISHVTNGVHVATWLQGPMRDLLDRHLGPGWLATADDPATWAPIGAVPDHELWAARCECRQRLVEEVRARTTLDRLRRGEGVDYAEAAERMLSPDVLTLGFARRIASYKRLDLLVADPGRALELLDGERPVQLFFAGKAHPMDEGAKRIVQELFQLKAAPAVAGRVAFLEDYDMELAAAFVSGCDVWINLPRPPQEASGTSGMKAALNGVLNLSVLDGWWAEAYDGTNGWAIDGQPDADEAAQDRRHAETLLDQLEVDVIPLFHERHDAGVPHRWVEIIKRSMMTVGPRFCATRMLRDYIGRIYFGADRTVARESPT